MRNRRGIVVTGLLGLMGLMGCSGSSSEQQAAEAAQGYYQRWRVQFDGKNYTAWHTHQIVGTIYNEDMSLKTVGNKEQGTWEYKDGALILTPKKMWASYYLTAKSIDDYKTYYVYRNYNTDTMESDEWYETPEEFVKSGVEREQNSGGGALFYLKKWPVAGFTKTELTVKVNMDVFKLNKKFRSFIPLSALHGLRIIV